MYRDMQPTTTPRTSIFSALTATGGDDTLDNASSTMLASAYIAHNSAIFNDAVCKQILQGLLDAADVAGASAAEESPGHQGEA